MIIVSFTSICYGAFRAQTVYVRTYRFCALKIFAFMDISEMLNGFSVEMYAAGHMRIMLQQDYIATHL